MKIKIETTIELKPHEVDAAHLWYLETAVEGESFRDWIKSMAASYCDYWVMSAWDNYGHAVDNLHSNKPEEGKQYLLMAAVTSQALLMATHGLHQRSRQANVHHPLHL